MTAQLEREITGIQQTGCPRCSTLLVTTQDAIGRTRHRCPKCVGVAKASYRHPDDAFMPQGLVRVASALPAIRAGQLRCQRCAEGVEGRLARFCERCGPPLSPRETTTCRTCGSTRLRVPGGWSTWVRCESCPPKTKRAPRFAEKVCACGARFVPTGPHAKHCEHCR
jgi:ribosomal protein L40E